jgi:3-dehydroquinate synthase
VQCLQGDKKVKAGQIRFVLPSAIGAVAIHDDVTLESIFAITHTN